MQIPFTKYYTNCECSTSRCCAHWSWRLCLRRLLEAVVRSQRDLHEQQESARSILAVYGREEKRSAYTQDYTQNPATVHGQIKLHVKILLKWFWITYYKKCWWTLFWANLSAPPFTSISTHLAFPVSAANISAVAPFWIPQRCGLCEIKNTWGEL